MRLCAGVIAQLLYLCRGYGTQKNEIAKALVCAVDPTAVVYSFSKGAKRDYSDKAKTYYEIESGAVTKFFNCENNIGTGTQSHTQKYYGLAHIIKVAKTASLNSVCTGVKNHILNGLIEEDKKKLLAFALLDVIKSDETNIRTKSAEFKRCIGFEVDEVLEYYKQLSSNKNVKIPLAQLLAGLILYSMVAVGNSVGRGGCKKTPSECGVGKAIKAANIGKNGKTEYTNDDLTKIIEAIEKCKKAEPDGDTPKECVLHMINSFIDRFSGQKDLIELVDAPVAKTVPDDDEKSDGKPNSGRQMTSPETTPWSDDVRAEYLRNLIEDCNFFFEKTATITLSGRTETQIKSDAVKTTTPISNMRRPTFQNFRVDSPAVKNEITDDIWKCISENSKVVLLGEPGSGKTFSINKITLQYAEQALTNEDALIPIRVPLGSFKNNIELNTHIVAECIQPYIQGIQNLAIDIDSGKFIVIFDAFNELVESNRSKVAEYLQNATAFIISCRQLDYNKEFSAIENVTKITILDLDLGQIKTYIYSVFYHDVDMANQLWERLGGSDALYEFWAKEIKNTPSCFWDKKQADNSSFTDYLDYLIYEYDAWKNMHSIGLLHICRNPYLLYIVCSIFDKKKALPENNGMLFEEFVNTCLSEEIKRKIKNKEINESQGDELKNKTIEVMTQTAILITEEKEGTGVTTTKGKKILLEDFSEEELTQCFSLGQGSTLLSVNNKEIRFSHQLVQEFFACQALKNAFDNDYSPEQFFNKKSWWLQSGWEEPAIILTGILFSSGDMNIVNSYLIWLADVQPNVMVRCIERAGITGLSLDNLSSETRKIMQNSLIARINGETDPIESKTELAKALGRIGDIREGVSTVIQSGKKIPAIDFVPFADEKSISRFPVTVAQFLCFIYDGYERIDMWDFDEDSITWFTDNVSNGHRVLKWKDERLLLHLNEPIVYVTWYEAKAFCYWYCKRFLTDLSTDIRLPSSQESKAVLELLPVDEKKYNSLIPVGLCSNEIDNKAVEDSGLVWEWCNDDCVPDDIHTCVLKGGSWRYRHEYCIPSYEFRTYPYFERDDIGFRIIFESKQIDEGDAQ